MGFNFQAGHANDVLVAEAAGNVLALIQARFGPGVPLGSPGHAYILPDELGWSWWSELGAMALERLGARGCTQIRATDAWMAVYLDVDVERAVLKLREPDAGPSAACSEPTSQGAPSWFRRMLNALGLRPKAVPPDAVGKALQHMVDAFGARRGERGALQVGNLRGLLRELEALLRVLGIQPSAEAVDRCRRSYSESDDRIDDDPAIQCLCHAWLTASHALEHACPLWLVK